MNSAFILLDDNFDLAKKIYKKINKKLDKSIVFTLGNFELNGLPYKIDKINRTKKLLDIGYDLVIEIPSSIYLSSIESLKEYLLKCLSNLNITTLYLGSEHSSLTAFNKFHNNKGFYYPSYDKVFYYYLNYTDYKTSQELSKEYISKFYQNRIYDYFNLNVIKFLIKNNVKIKLVKTKYFIENNTLILNNYFRYIKLFFITNPTNKITLVSSLDINTINMLKNKLYKIESFNDLVKLSLPKNFQFATFFKSILLSMISYNNDLVLKEHLFIKCLGFNQNGSKIIRNHNNNSDNNSLKIISRITPSNSNIEMYQSYIELLYSTLNENIYNSNSDLYIFPIKHCEN